MAEMRPFIGGGDMIKEVSKDAVIYNDPPMKFEAGTPGIVQTIGLGVALEYMMELGMENIAAHEAGLRDYAMQRLTGLNWLQVQGTTARQGRDLQLHAGRGRPMRTTSRPFWTRKGVAVRAGHHCAGPLMDHLGVTATCRASFGLYNTTDEVDTLIDALELAHDLFA